jgi:hypothetical protein
MGIISLVALAKIAQTDYKLCTGTDGAYQNIRFDTDEIELHVTNKYFAGNIEDQASRPGQAGRCHPACGFVTRTKPVPLAGNLIVLSKSTIAGHQRPLPPQSNSLG